MGCDLSSLLSHRLILFLSYISWQCIFLFWRQCIWAREGSNDFQYYVALAIIETYKDVIMIQKMSWNDILQFVNQLALKMDVTRVLERARCIEEYVAFMMSD
eukprot:Opistho-2@85090